MYAERQSGRRSSINNDPASTWTAGRNTNFEGATLLDAKKIQGTLQNLDKPKLEVKLLESVELQTNFDWRTDPRAANCPTVKEIRDQANWRRRSTRTARSPACSSSTSRSPPTSRASTSTRRSATRCWVATPSR